MKLAEALNLRADLQKRIVQLKERLITNAKVQEGDTPSESPEDLLKELDNDILELEDLIRRINKTNSTTFDGKTSIADIIAKKDTLSLKASIMREFVSEAGDKINRYSKAEIKIISTIDVAVKQKELNQLAKTIRQLDVKLQSLNWTTDLCN